jgi:plastocyanin
MRLDRLPVGEALVGFLLLVLVASFLVARDKVTTGEGGEDGGSPTATSGPTGTPGPGELSITMHDNRFDPNELTLTAGADVTIQLSNEGAAVHNVHVAGADGSYPETFCTAGGPNPCSDPTRIPGGDSGTLTFTVPDTPGEQLAFRCDFHPTEMKGTFNIQ